MKGARGLLIGLTGGIATGKSTAARFFAEAGARVIDADRLAREAVAPAQPALEEIRRAFGDGVLRPDGCLDREALAARVFADADARGRLNAIVHPRVSDAASRELEAIWAEDPGALVVYDVPLLYETGAESRFDTVVVVYAPRDEQLRRLMSRDGLSREAAEARLASQMDIEEKARRADCLLLNTGTLEDLGAQVRVLVAEFRRRLRN